MFDTAPPGLTAAGSTIAITGGIVAQASSADVGNVGLVIAIGGLATGILGAITQLTKVVLDARGNAEKLKDVEDKLAETKDDLAGSRKRRHEDASRMNGLLIKAEWEIMTLKAQLGSTDKSHSQAINAVGENIQAVADRTRTPLPAPMPHVEPIMPDPESDTDDEITAFTP